MAERIPRVYQGELSIPMSLGYPVSVLNKNSTLTESVKKTPASLGYPLSVINDQNSTIKVEQDGMTFLNLLQGKFFAGL